MGALKQSLFKLKYGVFYWIFLYKQRHLCGINAMSRVSFSFPISQRDTTEFKAIFYELKTSIGRNIRS